MGKGVDDFAGSVGDPVHTKLSSRLAHRAGQIHRFTENSNEEEELTEDLQLLLLALEGDLDFKYVPFTSN